jgi:ATP-dependent exoDNAse (exonuclease V) beta subunit
LYIPVFQPASTSRSSCGILGEKMPSALEALRQLRCVEWIGYSSLEFHNISQDPITRLWKNQITIPDPLLPDCDMNFIDRKMSVDSFSGLKLRLQQQEAPEKISMGFKDTDQQSGRDDVPFAGFLNTEGDPRFLPALPHSRETGLMMHEILEHIDYAHVGSARSPEELLVPCTEADDIITGAILKHIRADKKETFDQVKRETSHILWNTLHASLDGSSLLLCKVDKKIHEVEFYYPAAVSGTAPLVEMSVRDGFLHGFIDMIFLFKNKYYIVDWKSNYLEDGYAKNELEKNITEMHYDLQLSIYSTAVIHWLKMTVLGYTYEDHFGGVYYLYLRGMDVDNPGSGVYFFRPKDEHDMFNVLSLLARP